MKHFTIIMNFSKKVVQISVVLLILIQLQACSESPNNPVERESFNTINMNRQQNILLLTSDYKLDKVVNSISKSLALMLNEKSIREILATELQSSTYDHKIIDCLSLLKKDMIVNSKSVKLFDKLLEYIDEKDKNDFKNYINNLVKNYLFLGFPSKEHLNRWFESDDIFVVAVGNRPDGDESDVTAYNSKGEKINLVSNKLPTIPTIVIRTDESLTKKLTTTLLQEEDGGSGGGGGGGSTTTQYDVYIKGFEVGTNHESFWDWNGMELYFLVSAMNSDGTWGPWWSVTNPIEGFYADQYRDLGFYGIGIFSTLEQNFKIRIQVWDADSGSADDLVSDGYAWQVDGSIVPYFPNYIQPGYNITRRYMEVANSTDIDVLDLLQRIHN